jgi:hypothetical protein
MFAQNHREFLKEKIGEKKQEGFQMKGQSYSGFRLRKAFLARDGV